MKADEQKFLRFLEGNPRNFIIPVYQRNYDWGTEQCKKLFEDLKSIVENGFKDYFLGPIVSSIHESRDEIIIIDGQQRITTISLLLLAMHHLLDNNEKTAQSLKKGEIRDDYLVNRHKYSSTNPVDQSKKIRLKSIKNDAKDFNQLFEEPNLKSTSTSRVLPNYNFFRKQLLKEDLSLDDIFEAIRCLIIVDIQLKQGDNPQLVFESLNSTGLSLNESDKIRNFILMSEQPENQERYYDKYWREIEKNVLFQTNEFIYDFLRYKTNKEIKQQKIYFAFKDFYSSTVQDKEHFLQELLRFSEYYHWILQPSDFPYDKTIASLLKDLKVLQVNTFNCALLELIDDYICKRLEIEQLKMILETVISYVVRRNLLCELPTNTLRHTFISLIPNIKKKKKDSMPERYAENLQTSLLSLSTRAFFPKDDLVQSRLQSKNVYKMKNVHYFFDKLENYQNKEPVDIQFGCQNKKYQMEHIMPQKLTPNWKKELGKDWARVHEQYLHTLGNLTITGYNQELSNKSFAEKKEIGFIPSRLYLNSQLKNIECFNEEAILERLDQLIQRALKVWPYPQVANSFVKQNLELVYTFEDEEDFTGREILSYRFLLDNYFEIEVAQDWISFYTDVFTCLLKYDRGYYVRFREQIGDNHISSDKTELRTPKEVASSIYVEGNLSTMNKINNLKKIVGVTDFELSAFEFTVQE